MKEIKICVLSSGYKGKRKTEDSSLLPPSHIIRRKKITLIKKTKT